MPKLTLGRVVATPGALKALEAAGIGALPYLARHQNGDWGNICPEDQQSNRDALRNDARVVSSYRLQSGTVIWIITEADRSATCVLLPDEY